MIDKDTKNNSNTCFILFIILAIYDLFECKDINIFRFRRVSRYAELKANLQTCK